MDSSRYHIVYASRKAREDRVVWAAEGVSGGAVSEHDTGDLRHDLETLLKYSDVHLCATGASCLAKISQLHESSTIDSTPIVVLIDTPHDEAFAALDHRSRPASPCSSSPHAEAEIHTSDDEVYGLNLLQRVITEAHLRNRSKLVVPISVISDSSSLAVEPDNPYERAPSHSELCGADQQLLKRCIDLGAADVIVSPVNSKCVTSLRVEAYRAHKEAARERQALLEVRKGRKLSWFGVSEEKPFAYLREAMVSGLMKGICRLGGDVDDRVGNFKITVSTERQAAIAEAIGHWHFCAHDFADDELIIAAMIMFKHALSMPALEKWRIPTDQLLDFLVVCRGAYNTFVPYHNFRHVVDVLQATFHFLVSIGTIAAYPAVAVPGPTNDPPANSPIAQLLGPCEGLALLITAIGHDVGHPGVNNGFLVNLNAPVAQLYNDRSVLESFHCAAYSQILRQYWPSVFEEGKLRKLMISSILSTDMGLHFDYMNKLADTQSKLSEANTTDGWDLRMIEEQKALACSLLIKCADISNVARQHSTALQWMHSLADETSRQASMEGELGIPSSLVAPPKKDMTSLSKGQLGFMNLFAIPLFRGVADIMPAMRYTVEELEANKALFDAAMQEGHMAEVPKCHEAAVGDGCDASGNVDVNHTPETMIMRTPASVAVRDDEGEIAVSPLDAGSPLEAGYFVRSAVGLATEADNAANAPPDEFGNLRGMPATFESVADFAASDPFNMRYRLDSYDHGKPLCVEKQRCSETTDGSNSAPYSGDWTSQATSATTGKMPLSPSTQGTSIASSESLHRPTSRARTGGVVPEIVTPAMGKSCSTTELETEVLRHSSNEDSVSNGSLGKAEHGHTLRKKPSRFRMNALNLFRRNKAQSPGAMAPAAEPTFR